MLPFFHFHISFAYFQIALNFFSLSLGLEGVEMKCIAIRAIILNPTPSAMRAIILTKMLSLSPSSVNGSVVPESKLSVSNSLRDAAWKLYLNMEMYSIQMRYFGILFELTKNPPNTMRGMTKIGIKAIATSSLGTITEMQRPYDTP